MRVLDWVQVVLLLLVLLFGLKAPFTCPSTPGPAPTASHGPGPSNPGK